MSQVPLERACGGGCAGHGGHAGGRRAQGVMEVLDGCHSIQLVSLLQVFFLRPRQAQSLLI